MRSFLCLLLLITSAISAEIPPEKLDTLIGALTRLGPEKVNANPRLQAALTQVLDATRGTGRFVELVKVFRLRDRNADLLELAIAAPNSNPGVDAIRVMLENKGEKLIQNALRKRTVPEGTRLLEAVGNTLSGATVLLLTEVLDDTDRPPPLRKAAVRALAKFKQGAGRLIQRAKAGTLDEVVKLSTAMELNTVRWESIRNEVAKLLPLPKGRAGKAFPPIAELSRRKGDAVRGKSVFNRETVMCNRCHQVNGEGIDFGPALSEVGSKLTREALYESILAPNAGILMGYESWTVETKSGDEYYGLLVSETKELVSIKTVGGIVNQVKRAEILTQRKSKLSTMPNGLQQMMSEQDLVDLVEYLARLRAK
ncbi:MAG: putative heme-binding domain-containing protein [Limisphaerales bacterium]|jgi:putative heme-binding domain-containing protein